MVEVLSDLPNDILASATLVNGSSLHIASLSRKTVEDSGADHLGFSGLFLFEADDSPETKGIRVLGKVSSLEAAFRLMDIWRERQRHLNTVLPNSLPGKAST